MQTGNFKLVASNLTFTTETLFIYYIRQRQKELIRENRAVTGYTQWQVNGSLTAGRRMVTNMQKLGLPPAPFSIGLLPGPAPEFPFAHPSLPASSADTQEPNCIRHFQRWFVWRKRI